MFTGIIEETGKVVAVRKGQEFASLTIQAELVFQDLKLGDSVAVSGVCLTVSSLQNKIFTADVMNETFSRSTLGQLKAGSEVNLERAMAADGRFGGHIVAGHIDGTGTISNIRQDGNAVWVTLNTSEEIMKYIVDKGSVAIDGISLTVVKADVGSFQVSIIPHTGNATVLLKKSVGERVNLEVDMVGKYIEKFLNVNKSSPTNLGTVTMELLTKNGFTI